MNILIVDDEAPARERLQGLLSELSTAYTMQQAEHGIDALEKIIQTKPDIVLLDIRMPLMDGLEVARHLAKLEASPAVIFVTAYQDYALDAFDAHAVDYLLKPVRKERLQYALQRAQAANIGRINVLAQYRTHLSTVNHSGLHLVPVAKIHYFKADQKYVLAVWQDGEMLLTDSLKSLEQEFSHLLRIHRNTLVAKQYINGLEHDEHSNLIVTLKHLKEKLAVSRRYASTTREAIKNL